MVQAATKGIQRTFQPNGSAGAFAGLEGVGAALGPLAASPFLGGSCGDLS